MKWDDYHDFSIRRPAGRRLLQAKRFAERAYLQAGHVSDRPDSFPAHFYSFHGSRGELFGTIGCYLADSGKPLPSEQVFGFSLREFGVDPGTVGEVGRLSADGNGRLRRITDYFAYFMKTRLDLQYALFAVKPRLATALRASLGLELRVMHDLRPDAARVPAWARPYFLQGPRPVVILADLARARGPETDLEWTPVRAFEPAISLAGPS